MAKFSIGDRVVYTGNPYLGGTVLSVSPVHPNAIQFLGENTYQVKNDLGRTEEVAELGLERGATSLLAGRQVDWAGNVTRAAEALAKRSEEAMKTSYFEGTTKPLEERSIPWSNEFLDTSTEVTTLETLESTDEWEWVEVEEEEESLGYLSTWPLDNGYYD
jgi:hypothetical protein